MKRLGMLLAAAGMMMAGQAEATVVAQYLDGRGSIDNYVGQSFTVTGSGTYSDIAFNFLYNGRRVADGSLYLFSAAYNGTANGLASATTNLIAKSIRTGDAYYFFGSAVTLTAGVTYYAYADTSLLVSGSSSSNYSAGLGYFAGNSPSNHFAVLDGREDLNFQVIDNAAVNAVPEASTWAMMMVGLGLAGGALRRRRRAALAHV